MNLGWYNDTQNFSRPSHFSLLDSWILSEGVGVSTLSLRSLSRVEVSLCVVRPPFVRTVSRTRSRPGPVVGWCTTSLRDVPHTPTSTTCHGGWPDRYYRLYTKTRRTCGQVTMSEWSLLVVWPFPAGGGWYWNGTGRSWDNCFGLWSGRPFPFDNCLRSRVQCFVPFRLT